LWQPESIALFSVRTEPQRSRIGPRLRRLAVS